MENTTRRRRTGDCGTKRSMSFSNTSAPLPSPLCLRCVLIDVGRVEGADRAERVVRIAIHPSFKSSSHARSVEGARTGAELCRHLRH